MTTSLRFHAHGAPEGDLPQPLALAHFLPWYTLRGSDFPLPADLRAGLTTVPELEDNRHWCDRRSGYRRTHLHTPAIGAYDSRDPAVIAWQIEAAVRHGVDGFIVNWYGTYSAENVITLHWLRGLDAWNRAHPGRPFLYCLSIDAQAQWPTEGKRPGSREEDLAYIRDHLMTEAYLCRDGRPVFMVFPYESTCAQWRAALDATFGAAGADLIWRWPGTGAGADAAYAWIQPDEATIDLSQPYCWRDPDNAGDGFLAAFTDATNQRTDGRSYLMPGVWPGFNNQLVAWAWSPDPASPHVRPCVICRETRRGNTLDLTWQACLRYLRRHAAGDPGARLPAPLLQWITWNDYAETTTLEPTRDYGTAPLEQCRQRLDEARRVLAPN